MVEGWGWGVGTQIREGEVGGMEGFVGGVALWRVTFLLAFFGELSTNQRADGSI